MSWIEQTDNHFRDLNLHKLLIDQAYLNISNRRNYTHYLYSLSSGCIKCPYKFLGAAGPQNDTVFTMNAARHQKLTLLSKNHGKYLFPNQTSDGLVWDGEPELGEFGVYDLILDDDGSDNFLTALEPVNIYWSLLIVFLIIIILYWICKAINCFILSYWRNSSSNIETNKRRLKSLDIFRGMSIVLMIFVNYGGGLYWWMGHADWNGFLVADAVFPWFLFIMGVCIPMSVRSQFLKKVPIRRIVMRIFKRSLLLFLIGLCMFAQNVTFQEVRIMNVLQRFSIAYLAVSLIHVAFVQYPEYRAPEMFDDIKLIWKQWILMLVIVAAHTATVFGVKINQCDRGYVGPGGIHDYTKNSRCTGGIVGFIDRKILTEHHMYQLPNIRKVYDTTQKFDPEGIFGSLTTIFHAFLGLQCGVILMVFRDHKQRIIRWTIWGVMLAILTAILTFCRIEDAPIPINKNLWSITYVMATSASSFWLLALIYFLVDVHEIGNDCWTIFQYPGMNAILIYVGHLTLDKHWPFHFFVENGNAHFIQLLKNVHTTVVWILVAHILYHKKIFFSL